MCVTIQTETPQSWDFLELLCLLNLDFRTLIAWDDSWLIPEGATLLALEVKDTNERHLAASLWLLYLLNTLQHVHCHHNCSHMGLFLP